MILIIHHFIWQKSFVARSRVFLMKDYVSTGVGGSDVELELSEVLQNTYFYKYETWIDSIRVVVKSLVQVTQDLGKSDMSYH